MKLHLQQTFWKLKSYTVHTSAKKHKLEHIINWKADRRLVIFRTTLNIVSYRINHVAIMNGRADKNTKKTTYEHATPKTRRIDREIEKKKR